MRRLSQNAVRGYPETTEHVILEASIEIRETLFFATLIILLAVLPVFFLGGLDGALFQPLAVSYILALLAAMAISLVIIPVLSCYSYQMEITRRKGISD